MTLRSRLALGLVTIADHPRRSARARHPVAGELQRRRASRCANTEFAGVAAARPPARGAERRCAARSSALLFVAGRARRADAMDRQVDSRRAVLADSLTHFELRRVRARSSRRDRRRWPRRRRRSTRPRSPATAKSPTRISTASFVPGAEPRRSRRFDRPSASCDARTSDRVDCAGGEHLAD